MSRNWPGHTIRIDDELWDRFSRGVEAIRVKNPELGGRSTVVRELIRFWLSDDTLAIGYPPSDR